jgi:hypothetical protein
MHSKFYTDALIGPPYSHVYINCCHPPFMVFFLRTPPIHPPLCFLVFRIFLIFFLYVFCLLIDLLFIINITYIIIQMGGIIPEFFNHLFF